MRFRHLPTVVDGVLWDDSDRAHSELAALGYGDFHYGPGAGPHVLMVPTSEGTRAALPGESWVMRGTQGEWYPITLAVHAACYESVEAGEPS